MELMNAVLKIKKGVQRRAKWLARQRLRDIVISGTNIIRSPVRAPKPRTILLVEPNEKHTETLPGYITILEAAGYNVTLLVSPRVDVTGAISRLTLDARPHIVRATLPFMKAFLRSSYIRRYDLVFFNSAVVGDPHGYWGDVIDYIGKVPEARLGALFIEHSRFELERRLDHLSTEVDAHFALRQTTVQGGTIKMIAPTTIGTVATPVQRKPVTFVVVGRPAADPSFFKLLSDAVDALSQKGQLQFQVILVGAELPTYELTPNVRGKISALGFVPFKQMYEIIEACHFIIAPLDVGIESCADYKEDLTTGSRQLILGFNKPSLWQATFAEAYGLTRTEAIIYQSGRLSAAIERAIKLPADQYLAMAESVKIHQQSVFRSSVRNFNHFVSSRKNG